MLCQVAGQTFPLPRVWFVFQQTKFILADTGGKERFVRLEFPSEGSFRSYLGCRGLEDETAVAVAAERWGANVLDIPMPPFMKLFAEHAVAPFFVFQVRGREIGREGERERKDRYGLIFEERISSHRFTFFSRLSGLSFFCLSYLLVVHEAGTQQLFENRVFPRYSSQTTHSRR